MKTIRANRLVLIALGLIWFLVHNAAAQDSEAEALVREAEALQKSDPVKDASDERDRGVKAMAKVFERRKPGEKTLLAVQRTTCSSSEGWRGLVCGQAVRRLQASWKRSAGANAVTVYSEKYLPIIVDPSLPTDMRMSYAVDINMDLPGMRTKGMPYVIPDEVRTAVAKGMARIATDPALRHEALQACLTFGAGVPEAEDAVLAALHSEDAGFRQRAFFLLTSGANGAPRVAKGLKGVLDGRGSGRFIDELLKVLSEGSAKHPAPVVAMAALSAGHLTAPIKGIGEQNSRRIVDHLSQVLKTDQSPQVRYRAFEGLRFVVKFGPPTVQAAARQAHAGYDPRADERKALGGEGPFADWKSDE